ncbi:hypothetical protein [Joostella sp.]|uniref:hypothetical protein n=1 Tax=Joostella sp. TaxID=2231138 RepID=UPI003A8E35F3
MSVLLTVAGLLASTSGGSESSGIGGILDGLEGLLDKIKCWGSTWDAGKAKDFIENLATDYTNRLDAILPTMDDTSKSTLNGFLFDFQMAYAGEKNWYLYGKKEGCTEKALNEMIPALDAIAKKFKMAITEGFKQLGYTVTWESITYDHYYNGQHRPWQYDTIKTISKDSIFSNVGGTSNASAWWLVLFIPFGWFAGLNFFGKKSNKKSSKRYY